jgi:hypothetical protein
VVDRQFIVAAIQRTAAANGGEPPGRERFARETGIRASDWLGRYWARWGDALIEAGFEPNQFVKRIDDAELLAALIPEIRRLGRMPTSAELRLRARQDGDGFPSHSVFGRLGGKAEVRKRLLAYCQGHPQYSDVELALQASADPPRRRLPDDLDAHDDNGDFGFVYLMKSGRHYKIGRTNSPGRRGRELAIQLPERAETIHVIETDDPVGIENYWHRRFADHNTNGEWFDLSATDVKAFKRRKFM